MDILTRENKVIRVTPKEQKVESIQENAIFYKRRPLYSAVQIGEYLEISQGKKRTRLHIYREIKNVHVTENNIILVGDNWIELLEGDRLKKEREIKGRIIDTKVDGDLFIVLGQGTISIFSLALKRVSHNKIPFKYPDQILIHGQENKVIGILSGTMKKVGVFNSTGELIKTVSVEEKPKYAIFFRNEQKLYLCVGHGKNLTIEEIDGDERYEVSTEHFSAIIGISYSEEEKMIYSISQEGTLCQAPFSAKDAVLVYADTAGFKGFGG